MHVSIGNLPASRPILIALGRRGAVRLHGKRLRPRATMGRPRRSPIALSTVPAAFNDVQVAGGLTNPTQMEIAPDGRIFVSEQPGTVRIIKNGSLLTAPFVTVDANSGRGTRGPWAWPSIRPSHPTITFISITPALPGPTTASAVSPPTGIRPPGARR